jgi:hypothetical protein
VGRQNAGKAWRGGDCNSHTRCYSELSCLVFFKIGYVCSQFCLALLHSKTSAMTLLVHAVALLGCCKLLRAAHCCAGR